MDIYLLQLLGNWLSVLVVTLSSLFGNFNYSEDKANLENTSPTKTATVINEVVNFKTKYVYNNKKPIDSTPTVVQEGQVGLIYRYDNGDTKILRGTTDRIIELGTAKAVNYTGRVTTYTPYCKGCSKYGNVACYTKNHKKHSLITNGQYYVDDEFGKVRIIAAALQAFPCGTIMKIDTGKIEPFYAVVLDTGGTMRSAYKKGTIWIDLAYSQPNKAEAKLTTGKNVKMQVQRWGW